MKLGNLDVDTFKLGSAQVDKVYLGDTEVWSGKFTAQLTSEVYEGLAGYENPDKGSLVPSIIEEQQIGFILTASTVSYGLNIGIEGGIRILDWESIRVAFDDLPSEVLPWSGEPLNIYAVSSAAMTDHIRANIGVPITVTIEEA